jgi:16S rRNA processing protein RimM
MLIVKTLDDREVMVPFVKALVPEVNVAEQFIIITPPAGLFEDLEESGE